MTCKQCRNITVCIAQADGLGQVFDTNYDGEHGCNDFVPFTNADRIRSMTDDELVVFLDEFSGRCLNCVEDAKNKSCPIYKEGYYCKPQDIMDWLRQPAE